MMMKSCISREVSLASRQDIREPPGLTRPMLNGKRPRLGLDASLEEKERITPPLNSGRRCLSTRPLARDVSRPQQSVPCRCRFDMCAVSILSYNEVRLRATEPSFRTMFRFHEEN